MNDVKLIADAAAGTIIGLAMRGLWLMAQEAYIKPAAIWAGKHLYQLLDRLFGDRLPDWFKR